MFVNVKKKVRELIANVMLENNPRNKLM